MEADLVARLAAWPAVAAVIGVTRGVASISWGLPLQGTARPWLVLSKVSPGRDYTHSGPDGLDGPRVQFDALADLQDDALALGIAVRACIEAGGTQGDTKFSRGFLEADSWIDEGEQEGGRPLYRFSQDMLFYYEEI